MSERIRILLVEDSEEDTILLLRELRNNGFDPVHQRVETEDQMRAALAARTWDLIISDHNLPSFDSLRALECLREIKLDIPFFVVSGSTGEETAVDLMRAGAADYVMKGNLKRLPQAIHRELRDAGVRRDRRIDTERLRQADEQLETFFEHSPLAVFSVDMSGIIETWNPKAVQLFGFPAAKILGNPLPVIPAGEEDAFREILAAHGRGTTLEGVEMRWRTRFGVAIVGEVWTGILHVLDSPTSILFIVADVTERRRLEEQVRQAQKMEAIGRLAGGVAHDFNNLLLVITGYCDLAKDRLPPDDSLLRLIGEINGAADRAAGLTRQLLAFSRRQIIAPKVLDLNAVIEAFQNILRRLIHENVDMRFSLDAALGRVRFDVSQLEQVVLNLLLNARDAMPEGGQVLITTRNLAIDYGNSGEYPGLGRGQYVALSVRDTGQGMDAETLSRLFEPFFTSKEPGKGTGLGLSTVYGIVKRHAGEVFVRSRPGEGSTFEVALPRVDATVEPLIPAAPPMEFGRNRETILFVEDDPAVRALVRDFLEKGGFHVFEASDSGSALELFTRESSSIDLLLTDMVLPTMSGRDLSRQLREIRPDLKVVFTSGYAEELSDLEQREDDLFLEKPFAGSFLVAKLREALDGANAVTVGQTERLASPGTPPMLAAN